MSERHDRTINIGERTVAIQEGGDLDGVPVFYHHGTPSCRVLLDQWAENAAAQGIRLIGHDRPGYGGSTRTPGRIVAAAAYDVEAIADRLGIERYATWGISGGGPHALACGALSSDRVVAVATLASVAPYGADDLDFTAGMGEENIAEFNAALEGSHVLVPLLEGSRPMLIAGTAQDIIDAMSTVLSDVDRAVISEVADYFVEETQEALGRSCDGWLDDDLGFVRPWGFDVADISVPVLLWQGRQDLMVPYEHGEWLAARIPGVDARLLDDEGHLTLMVNRVSETHAWLKGHF